jgi:hypothetical protein
MFISFTIQININLCMLRSQQFQLSATSHQFTLRCETFGHMKCLCVFRQKDLLSHPVARPCESFKDQSANVLCPTKHPPSSPHYCCSNKVHLRSALCPSFEVLTAVRFSRVICSDISLVWPVITSCCSNCGLTNAM